VCCSCGCVQAGTGTPGDDHGNPANVTLQDLFAAAGAAGISPDDAALNLIASLRMAEAVLDIGDGAVAKGDNGEAQRYVLGIAYQPGKDPRIAKGVDGGRDWFSEAELEKAAWSYMRNGPQVNAFHAKGTEGCATVVESYVYRGPDWDVGDGIVVTKGTWLVGAILDDRSWDLARQGKINGWSPEGTARRRQVVKG
jgi:hypothetical protein